MTPQQPAHEAAQGKSPTVNCACCDGSGEHIVNRHPSHDPLYEEADRCTKCDGSGQVRSPVEADLWRLIDAEGGVSSYDGGAYNDAIGVALRHVESLGYSEGVPVPTAAHYAALKEALRPFADLAENWVGDDEADGDRYQTTRHFPQAHILVGWLRRAATLLEQSK